MTENEIIRLAQKLRLGRAMKPVGLDTGDVFYTDNSYRTAELLAFADAMQSHGYAEGRKDQAAETSKAPQGWKLVPEVPTQEMCQQGQWKAQEWPKFPLRISPIYQAMIAAAPEADK